MFIFIWTEASFFDSTRPVFKPWILFHQRQACLFFWRCWSSPSHNKLRTPSQFDKDEVIGGRHISLRYQGFGVVIGEETIQSCQLDTRAFSLTDVPSPWWGNEWCPTAVTATLAPSLPSTLAKPWPARPSLPITDTAPQPPPAPPEGQGRFLHLTRNHDEDFNYLQDAKNQMPNRDNPCCVPQSCTHSTLHVQDLFVFLIGHGPMDESEEMPTCSSRVLSFTVHGSLPLSTGSALPCTTGRKMIVSRFHHICP